MSNIPQARELVQLVIGALDDVHGLGTEADVLRVALNLMTREPMAKPRAAPRFTCTREVADEIRAYMRRWPNAQIIDVAVRFGVGTGRVSEIINGRR